MRASSAGLTLRAKKYIVTQRIDQAEPANPREVLPERLGLGRCDSIARQITPSDDAHEIAKPSAIVTAVFPSNRRPYFFPAIVPTAKRDRQQYQREPN